MGKTSTGSGRRRLGALVVIALLGAGCSSSSPDLSETSAVKPSAGATTPASDSTSNTTGVSAAASSAPIDTGAVGKALAAGGIGIVPIDALDAAPAGGPLVVTDFQAAAWQGQIDVGGGISGTRLRTLVGQADDQVPIDFLVAEWLHEAATPAAQQAVALAPITGLTDPGAFDYPWAVLALFVNDAANSAASASATPTTTPATDPATTAAGGPSRITHAPAPTDDAGVCGALQGLYDNTVGAVITELQSSDSFLANLAGAALDTFVGFVSAAISKIPLIATIITAVQVLGLIAAVAAAVQPWSGKMHATPTTNEYGTAGAPHTGTISVDLGTSVITKWPDTIQSCATVFHLLDDLPSLDPSGAKTQITFEAERADGAGAQSAVVPPGQPKTIKGTLHKGISGYEDDIIYQTGTDPDPAAEETGVELITATGVIFQDSDAVDKIVQTLIHKAIAKATSILNSLPGHPDVSSVVEFLTSSGNSVIPAALAPEGAVDIEPITVPVTYHLAKPPDPTTPPTAAPTTSTTIQTDDGASCTLIPLTIVPTDFLTQLNLGNINLTLQDNGTAVLDWNGSTTLTDPSGDNIQIRGTQTTTWTRDGGANYTFGVLSGDLEAYLQIAGTGDYQDIGPINTSGLGAASEELAGLLVGTASCSNFTLTFAPAEGAPTGVQFHYAYQVTPGPAPTTTVAPGG